MNLLIDSGVLIQLGGGVPHWITRLDQEEGVCAISVVTLDELLRTVASTQRGTPRAKRMAFIQAVAERFEILPIDESVARVHATLREDLGKRLSLGLHESWIAATCLAHGLALVTDDARDYRCIKGLDIWKASSS